jgi:predicted HAD superfamily Cof-like phosphohydrolase
MSYFDDVKALYRKFEIPIPAMPELQNCAMAAYRMKFLKEELDEIHNAMAVDDLIGLADGLADLVYVALGTAAHYGIPFDEVWQLVHQANMTKQRAPAGQTKRGHVYDLIKPADFVPPDLAIERLLWEKQQ